MGTIINIGSKAKKFTSVVTALMLAVTIYCPVTIGRYTATYGEIEISGRMAEVNAIGTGQGFRVRNRNYKECVDYILIIDNKGTPELSDDTLKKIIKVG